MLLPDGGPDLQVLAWRVERLAAGRRLSWRIQGLGGEEPSEELEV